jgi:Zn-finger nucleic acid-binding protein
VFHGAKFCGHCGAKVTVPAEAHADGTASARVCPRCGTKLVARLISDVLLDECPSCHGVFVDMAALERILTERRQARADALLGTARPEPAGDAATPSGPMYVKCPDCGKMMNRKNFASGSGIIVDICKSHGTWFDANELPRVIDFVMKGGLERAEKRDAERVLEEARRTRSQQYAAVTAPAGASLGREVDRVGVFGSILGAVGRILVD